jgi:hypothetical protein
VQHWLLVVAGRIAVYLLMLAISRDGKRLL